MAVNNTEIQHAIRIMLKRYDIVQAWKYIYPAWVVNIAFSFIFTVFTLWFLLSVAVYSPPHSLYCIVGKPYAYFLVLFAGYPIHVFCLFFFIFFTARTILDKVRKKQGEPDHEELNKIARKCAQRNTEVNTKYISRHTWEYYLLLLLALINICTIGPLNSLLLIIPFSLLVVLPMIFRAFSFSIFLPRIIITVSYIWVSFIFTEENTRYLRLLPDTSYVLTFIIATFGSIGFLWFEAYQNAPSVRKSELLVRRVLPVFAFAVFFSVLMGFVFELTSNTKKAQSTSAESYHFGSTLNIMNTSMMKLNSIKDFRNRIESGWRGLPDISSEVGFQQQGRRHYYSEVYNKSLANLKQQMAWYNEALIDLSESKMTDSVMQLYSDTSFDFDKLKSEPMDASGLEFLDKVYTRQSDSLRNQVKVSVRNDSIMREQLSRQESILQNLEYRLIRFYDTIAEPAKSSFLLRKLSGYSLITSYQKSKTHDLSSVVESIYQISLAKESGNKRKSTDSNHNYQKNDLLYTEYPIHIPLIKSADPVEGFNLKRFLIEVIIAVAIGVIGQLILADKTVTEAV